MFHYACFITARLWINDIKLMILINPIFFKSIGTASLNIPCPVISDLIPLNSIFSYPIGSCPTTMSHPPLCLRLYHPIQCLSLLNFTSPSHPFPLLQMSGCMLRLAMWPTEKLWTYVDKIMTGPLSSCKIFASYIPILYSRYKLPTYST